MTQSEFLAQHLAANFELLKMTIADMSDADLLVRPVPGANHPKWQIGHLAGVEGKLLMQAGGTGFPELPAGFSDRFNKTTAGNDDPAFFPSKEAMLDIYSKVRAAAVAWVKTLSPQDMEKPGPEELRSFAATVGDLILMTSTHLTMHLGQIQVLRRKLGKPVLF